MLVVWFSSQSLWGLIHVVWFSSLSLWGLKKKKPLVTVKNAHSGADGQLSSDVESWITCVTSLQYTDLIASGWCMLSNSR